MVLVLIRCNLYTGYLLFRRGNPKGKGEPLATRVDKHKQALEFSEVIYLSNILASFRTFPRFM